MLPNFILIGGERCGTTWVYNCLKDHPEIYIADIKEIDFFSKNYNRGLSYYENLFKKANKGNYRAVGEKSTDYMSDESCPERIVRHIPKAKLIAILRNPIDRAFSHYLAFHGSNPEASFEEAIKNRPGLLIEGHYYEHLQRYYKYFDKDQILVLFFDDIWQDRLKFIQSIYEYLKVNDEVIPRSLREPTNIVIYPGLKDVLYSLKAAWIIKLIKMTPLDNVLRQLALNRKGKTYPKMKEETRRNLALYFNDSNNMLSKMCNRDLSNWQ